MTDEATITKLPLTLKIVVTTKNDKPCVELRRAVTDMETIKDLISAALKNQPVVILPQITDVPSTMNNLIRKGIVYINKDDGNYYFTF